jgi:hypothetical protein
MQELYNSDNRNKRDNNKSRDVCMGSDATAREPEKRDKKLQLQWLSQQKGCQQLQLCQQDQGLQ